MEAASVLERYFQRVRRRFPPGFSKYFYTEDRTKEERKGLDEDLKDDFLSSIREEAIRMQSSNKKVTYLRLVRKFGWPLTLALSLLWENLPEEVAERFKRICRRFCLGTAACVIIALSIFSAHTVAHQSDINVREVKTLVVEDDSMIPGAQDLNDFSLMQFIKNLDK